MPETSELLIYIALGFFAGALGGLLGIGGSIIMIPVLVILDKNYHLAQAAAMIVNFFVAAPALLRHHRADAVRWDLFRRMLPFGLVMILVGVLLSNRMDSQWLELMFGVFLVYVIVMNVIKVLGRVPEPHADAHRVGWPTGGFVGGLMGFAAGLLGIGGGGLAVPLLQRVCNLPLRQCIATSSAVMCITALVGAAMKNATISQISDADFNIYDSLVIALCLAPTAMVGGLIGAELTHRLPLRYVRLAFIVLLVVTTGKMLGLY